MQSESYENSVIEEIEELEEYEVEKILDSKKIKGLQHYLIRWAGFSEGEDTWEPAVNIVDKQLIKEFNSNNSKGKKRSNKSVDSKAKVRKSKGGGKRVNKKQLAEENRAQNIQARKGIYIKKPVVSHKVELKDYCCLICAARLYSQAMESEITNPIPKLKVKSIELIMKSKTFPPPTGNKLLDSIVKSPSKVPEYKYGSFPDDYSSNALAIAMKANRVDWVATLVKSVSDRANPPVSALKAPNSGTGYISKRTFGHAVNTVNESRGNREGNNAFYKNEFVDTMQLNHRKASLFFKTKDLALLNAFMDPKFKIEALDKYLSLDYTKQDSLLYSFIHEMASRGKRDIVVHLIEKAENHGFNHLHLEVVKNINGEPLTSYRLNQVTKKVTGHRQIQPLHLAAINPKSVYLSEFFDSLSSAEFIEVDGFGRNVAHFAAVSETTACLEFLIKKRFDVDTFDQHKVTPVMLAAMHGKTHNFPIFLEILGSEAFATKQYSKGWTLLHYAAHYGHVDSVKWLIEHIPLDLLDKESKASALHHSAKMGHLECVKLLTKAGAEPDIKNKFGCSPLHLAAKNGRFDIVQHLLIDCGVDINDKDTSDNTPLHYAAAYGWLDIVDLLILIGADINASNIWKTTPLAIADSKEHVAVANRLLDNPKVDANFKNKEGMNLLHTYVVSKPDNWYDANRLTTKAHKLISRDNIDLATGDINDNTPLHLLVGSNFYVKSNIELPEEPPKRWADKVKYDKKKKSNELHGEFHDNHGTQIQIDLADLCIQIGCDINFKNKRGYTPLACAMNAGHIDMVKYLLDTKKVDIASSIGKHDNNILHFILKQFALYQAESKVNEGVDSIESRRIKRIKDKLNGLLNSLFNGHYNDQLKGLSNLPNNKGFAPTMYGIMSAYNFQKKKTSIQDLKTNKFNKITNTKNLDFQYDYFIKALDKIIVNCSTDVNFQVPYPKYYFSKDKKPDPEKEPKFTGWSALHFACNIQEFELVKILIKHGGDPNQINFGHRDGRTPFRMASEFKEDPSEWVSFNASWSGRFSITYTPRYTKWILILNQLLDAGGDPFIIPKLVNNYKIDGLITQKFDSSPILFILMNIKEEELLHFIAKLKVNFGEVSKNLSLAGNCHGMTPLMRALELNKIDLFKILLATKLDINTCNNEGDTILMLAIKKNNVEVTNLILSSSFEYPGSLDLSLINKNKDSTLTLIGQHNCKNAYKLISSFINNFQQIDHQDNSGKSALFWACQHNVTEVVEALVKNGANINLPCIPPASSTININENGMSPLMVAINNYSKNTLSIVKSLVNHGAQMDFTDQHLSTALHYAVLSQDHKVTHFLLESGVDVNSRDQYQHTPLHLAVKGTLKQIDKTLRIERLLIEYGADINVVDYQGRTPLHLCFSILHIIPYMNYTQKFLKPSQEAKQFIEKEESKDINTKECFNELEIKECWFRKFITDNKILPAMREEIKPLQEDYSADWFNNSPYRYNEFEKGYFFEKDDPIDLIRYLLTLPSIKVDEKDVFGRTPLHYSSRVGAFTCTKYLIEHGASLNNLDLDKNSPFHMGLLYGHFDYSNMLLNMGAEFLAPLTLTTGSKITPFYRSLEKSFMPLAYLITDQEIEFLKAFHDTLKSGKLHLAATLLKRAKPEHITSINQNTCRNIMHILADVTPIDKCSWNDYVVEFLSIIDKFNVPSDAVDKENFTPLIIAAKHSQIELCQVLIERNPTSKYINQVTKCGKTALWYAIKNNDVTTAKMLLKRNAELSNIDISKNPSLIFLAVSHSPHLIKEIIKKGADVDDDILYGRSSAFILSLLDNPFTDKNQRIEFWELLLSNGANLNKPGPVPKFRLKLSKSHSSDKESVIIHPAFLAIELNLDEKKYLFEHGLHCNVKHPITNQYLVKSIDDVDTLELLLKQGIDLNSRDSVTNRPFIYELVIGHHRLLTNKPILLWNNVWNSDVSLDLSSIDPVTNQTPLEFAIRNNDLPLFSHLLNHGANPYTHSCLKKENNSKEQNLVDAIAHTLNLNRPEFLQALFDYADRTNTWTNWNQPDPQFRTSLFYIITPNQSTFYNNFDVLRSAILKITAAGMSIDKMEAIRDKLGFTCLEYSAMSHNLEVYNGMVNLGFKALSPPDLTRLQRDFNFESLAIKLDVNLPKVEVDKDAELGRKYLEDLEISKPKKEDLKPSDPLKEVDPNSDLKGIGEITLGHEKEPLTMTMNRSEMSSMYYTNNMFYVLQLIYNPLTTVYVLFTRWGSIGEVGMFQRTPFTDFNQAVKEFEAVFKAKTGNLWSHRADDKFEAKPGKFVVTKTFKPKPMAPIQMLIESSSPIKSILPENTKNLIRLFTHLSSMKKVNKDTDADLPLGFLSNDTIKRGRQILEQIRAAIDDFSKYFYANDMGSSKERALKRMEIIQLNSLYFTTVPKLSQDFNNINPITNFNTLAVEITRLNSIQYLNSGANILLASHAKLDKMNPLDYCYSALNRTFIEIPVHHPEFSLVHDLISSSIYHYDLVQLIKLEQVTEFDSKFKDTARKLLWHGSSLSNFIGILSQGLRVAPVEANAHGYMFGKGIYFGDAFDKSIGYANTYSDLDCGYSCLLLSEVAVGKSRCHIYSNYYSEVPEGYDSVLGMGKTRPNPEKVKYTSNGCEIPSSELVKLDLSTVPLDDETYSSYMEYNLLNYNEYIVYEQERVKMVYLVVVKDKTKCHLCNSTNDNKSIISYLNLETTKFNDKFPPNASKFNTMLNKTYLNCNLFEILMAEGLLNQQNLDLHTFVQKHFTHYIIANKKYLSNSKWNPVTPLTPTTKICINCFRQCIGIAIDFYLRDNRNLLPDPIQALSTCWHGRECRNQTKNNHFKKFWHAAENSRKEVEENSSNGTNDFNNTDDTNDIAGNADEEESYHYNDYDEDGNEDDDGEDDEDDDNYDEDDNNYENDEDDNNYENDDEDDNNYEDDDEDENVYHSGSE